MTDTVLATKSLTKRYGSHLAVDRAELTVQKGQIYGLVGRNGAGKTTIIRMITGQTAPTAGEISLFGATGKDLLKLRARTGVMVETPSFYPYLTARQNLEYYRLQRGIPGKGTVDQVLEETDLADTGKKVFKNFSLGMKQRLGLALALMNRPDFLLLDEPINGLDPEGIVEFRNLLLKLNQERQTTILISSHILPELANLATCYGFIDKGVMLEQITARALEEKCRACIEVQVGDASAAALVLEQQLGTRDYEVLPGGTLRLYSFLDQPQTVSRVLVEGGVEVCAYGAGSKPVALIPSQQYVLDVQTRQAEVKKVDVQLYTGWVEGMFVFKNQRLEDVMTMLARWYSVDVFYIGESVKDIRLSANLGRYEHIDKILDIIQETNKIGFSRKGNVVTVMKK